ncbi:helix-turn-helix transcriptional regulator [Pseudomonas syringae]|uniref:helix-turn-helix transcriptional regulator n=1 Tax=Pseudomonas syringae TaxID=317 RepID=UPI003AFFC3CD
MDNWVRKLRRLASGLTDRTRYVPSFVGLITICLESAVLVSVLRARQLPITAVDLAQGLGVSQRGVYRDIEIMRLLRAPIDGQSGIGYALGKGLFLPQFAFSSDELDALRLGLGWVQGRAN